MRDVLKLIKQLSHIYKPLISESLLTNRTYVELCHENVLGLVMHSLLLHLQMFRVKQSFENLRSPSRVQIVLQTDFQEVFYSTYGNGIRQNLQRLHGIYLRSVFLQQSESHLQIWLCRPLYFWTTTLIKNTCKRYSISMSCLNV